VLVPPVPRPNCASSHHPDASLGIPGVTAAIETDLIAGVGEDGSVRASWALTPPLSSAHEPPRSARNGMQPVADENDAWIAQELAPEMGTQPGCNERAVRVPGVGEAGANPSGERLDVRRAAKGLTWTTEQRSRDDWPRAWKWIAPLFADARPKTVKTEHLIGDPAWPEIMGLRSLVAAKVPASEAHRVIKVWRAPWAKMAVFGYRDVRRDPSFRLENSSLEPRQAVWCGRWCLVLAKPASSPTSAVVEPWQLLPAT
jgi:hypothetical protein